ncbi:hypothetical protein KY285_026088 [Solanum tuberosum]|nr:hypothetical protein KY285_026088 [Solanum tuberosum]
MVEDPMTIPASISNGCMPGLIDDELPDTFCGEDSVFTNCGADLRPRECVHLNNSTCVEVKAMELIDQLEVGRRGPYSGGFGGISFSGDMDIGLALRTMVFMNGPRYDTMYSYTDASNGLHISNLRLESSLIVILMRNRKNVKIK